MSRWGGKGRREGRREKWGVRRRKEKIGVVGRVVEREREREVGR